MPAKKEPLSDYIRKRDFAGTPEPPGRRARSSKKPIFVIQKHAARRLHYDFRLEAEGVLKSWAIPKVPVLDPSVKRLAVPTEDHPLDYASFAGTIPEGHYGAGEVEIWDAGTYENLTERKGKPVDLPAGIRSGHIRFRLAGKRLRGLFALTRIEGSDRPGWLFVKVKEPAAAEPAPLKATPDATPAGLPSKAGPTFDPMLATLTEGTPAATGWIFEPKLDGERCLALKQGGDVRLFSRRQLLLNTAYPELVDALRAQKADGYVVDGEVVAFDPGSTISRFSRLQHRMHVRSEEQARRTGIPVYYFLFDLLYADGQDWRSKPLSERKRKLAQLLEFKDPLRLTPSQEQDGAAYYRHACRSRWEGVIAKRLDSVYAAGRSRDWLKFKCVREQEFVIGGFTDPEGSRSHFGALLLGYYDQDRLRFAGKVGTGFDATLLADIAQKLNRLRTPTSPFGDSVPNARAVHWVKPELTAQIGFAEWTPDGHLRQPRFLGLRRDKEPREVTREEPASAAPEAPPAVPVADAGPLDIEGRKVAVTRVTKVLYPEAGFTKGHVIDYYIRVAHAMLPHLRDRPLSLKRYPNGVDSAFFFSKEAPDFRPSWIKTATLRDESDNGRTRYVMAQDLPSLVWLANLAALEIHPLLFRMPKTHQPTLMVFDLDPGAPADLLDCVRAALDLRQVLKENGLVSAVKTSGSKGLHLYVPLNTPVDFDRVREWAHGLALQMEAREPARFTSNMSKARRPGKILVDWSQNHRFKSTVAAYSLRATRLPGVSTPVAWDEVEESARQKDTRALQFSPQQVLQRVERLGDLFSVVNRTRQQLKELRPAGR